MFHVSNHTVHLAVLIEYDKQVGAEILIMVVEDKPCQTVADSEKLCETAEGTPRERRLPIPYPGFVTSDLLCESSPWDVGLMGVYLWYHIGDTFNSLLGLPIS